MSFDVAVINTLSDFPLTKFAILPNANLNLLTTTLVTTLGWGLTEKGAASETLLKVRIPIVSNTKCKAAWKDYFSDTALCAGRLTQDSCRGDSGMIRENF